MARSDLLRRLFASYAKGDDAQFRAVAAQIVADERRKNHQLLASELESELSSDLRRPGAAVPLTLRPLPKSRDDRPLLTLAKPKRHFDDLVLLEGATDTLQGIIEENLARTVLTSHALRPRQRLLFVGPPGTGKSMTAHAVAAELSLPVATASLPALTSSFLGETARNIESVVQFAELTPCVLLMDEFDTLAQERGERGDHGEIRRVVASVLQLFEGMRGESLVVATSNHPGLLDSAIWRRFDEIVPFGRLDAVRCAQLISLKLLGIQHSVDFANWGHRLANLSPAEIEAICSEVLRRAALDGLDHIRDDMMDRAVRRHETRASELRKLFGATAQTEPPSFSQG